MRPHLSTIIKQAGEAKRKEDKIAILHQHDHTSLRTILGLAFDKRVEWDLPEGRPPYKPAENQVDQEDMLYSEIRRLYLFVKPGAPMFDQFNPNLTPRRRETLFIQLLEVLPTADAELLLDCKERKIKGLNAKICNQAWPGLMPE